MTVVMVEAGDWYSLLEGGAAGFWRRDTVAEL